MAQSVIPNPDQVYTGTSANAPTHGDHALSRYDNLLKIGEFAELAKTNLRTLRYYEELGLLVPALRSEGGFRYYRPTDASRVKMIHGLQDLGLQLEQIRELLDVRNLDPKEGEDDRAAWIRCLRTALTKQRALIDDRIELLSKQQGQIDDAFTKLDICEKCDHLPAEENNFCDPCARTGIDIPEYLSALF